MFDKDDKSLAIAWDDEIITGTLVAKDGAIVHSDLTANSLGRRLTKMHALLSRLGTIALFSVYCAAPAALAAPGW